MIALIVLHGRDKWTIVCSECPKASLDFLSGSCLTCLIYGLQPHQLHDHDPDIRNQIDHRVHVHGKAEHEDHNLQGGKYVVIVADGAILLGHRTLARPSTIYQVVFPAGTPGK